MKRYEVYLGVAAVIVMTSAAGVLFEALIRTAG